jgi:hypothetical protein
LKIIWATALKTVDVTGKKKKRVKSIFPELEYIPRFRRVWTSIKHRKEDIVLQQEKLKQR